MVVQPKSLQRITIMGGLSTSFFLIVPIIGTIGIVMALEEITGMRALGEKIGIAVLATVGIISGGLWGNAFNRLQGLDNRHWLMRVAGGVSLFPSVLLSVQLLLALDNGSVLDKIGVNDLPQYQQYTVVFVSSVFVVATVSSLALGLAATHWRKAARIALLSGLAATASFFVVNMLMRLAGFRVGGPYYGLAKSLPPMPTITLLGSFVGGMVGGGLLGRLLALDVRGRAGEQSPAPEPEVQTDSM